MGFRERIEWLGRLTLLVFVLASVAFLSAITTMRIAIQGREMSAANVIGMPLAKAQALLGSRGLRVQIEDRVYSTLPQDAIVRQSPQAGTELKVGETVHVVVSLGAQKVTIPDLNNHSLHAAQIELLSEGLQTGEISSAHLAQFPADIVLKQDPAPGATNASSPHVDLLVSLGPEPAAYVMPGLTGLTLADAQEKLSTAGLKVSQVTPLPGGGVPLGTVIAQLPAKGARIEPGTSVELQVAQ
ncbi:MAG TPA: PASTA domain-containing protein [Candidatus Acidoferrales bacterium]|nr:PASTA domain-containing protein [Candidatus Acidoferrales bacterium]